MAFVLTKKTKFNTKFKENNLYFLSELKRRLTLKNWTKDSNSSYVICMATTEYPYCWDSVSLIEKNGKVLFENIEKIEIYKDKTDKSI